MKDDDEALIVCNPEIMLGKPTIRGTRITVAQVLRLSARGLTAKEIADQHPHLAEASILGAIGFAADAVEQQWRTSQPEGHDDWLADGPEWRVVGED